MFSTHHFCIHDLNNYNENYKSKIPQIGKEFDLLRFNKTSVANIELKSKASEEKILKQLKRNRYYLQFLDKEVSLFTYVQETEKLYMLDKEQLTPVSFDFLTEHQEEIRTNVMKVVETSTTEFMALTGAAGTGKTLLTYELPKRKVHMK